MFLLLQLWLFRMAAARVCRARLAKVARLAGLLADVLNFCKNDENFKRKTEVI